MPFRSERRRWTSILDSNDTPVEKSQGNVTIHRVSDNRVLQRLPSFGPDSELATWDGVAFSPDGTYLQQRWRSL